MEHFYEEQKQRLEYLNHETVYFQDIVCQMYFINEIFIVLKIVLFFPYRNDLL
jgi:hypothetical protein